MATVWGNTAGPLSHLPAMMAHANITRSAADIVG